MFPTRVMASAIRGTEARPIHFHHAVRGEDEDLTATIDRLRTLTATGDFAYFTEIARFMAGVPLPDCVPRTRWLDGETATRERWQTLVAAHRAHLITPCPRARVRAARSPGAALTKSLNPGRVACPARDYQGRFQGLRRSVYLRSPHHAQYLARQP